jgi:hypothetical protein
MGGILRRVLALGVLLLFAVMGGTASASPWSEHSHLSSAGGSRPLVAVDGRGDAIAAWTGAGRNGVWVSRRLAGDVFSPPLHVGDGSGPQVAINENGLSAVAWSAGPGGVRALVDTTEVVSGPEHPSTGGWAPLDVAIDRAGDVVVAWFSPRGDNWDLLASWRPAGGTFGSPELVGTYAYPTGIALTADRDGHAVLAWQASDNWVSYGDVAHGFGTPVAMPGDTPAGIGLAGNDRGDAVLAWTIVSGSGAVSQFPAGTYVAAKPPGGSFGPARLVIPEQDTQFHRMNTPAVAVAPDGAAAVSAGSTCGVPVVTRPFGGDWGAPRAAWADCALPHDMPAIAIDSTGRAVVAAGAARGEGEVRPLLAARDQEDPVVVSAEGSQNFAPSLGFDAVGNGLMVWEGDDGPGGDRYGLETSRPIQLVLYDGSRPAISGLRFIGRSHAFRFRLSEAARVTVRIERRRGGRKVGTLRARGLAGPNAVRLGHALRAPGRYRATIDARDSAGKRARQRRLSFRPY